MLRISGGSLRGRRFAAPKGRATRPTQEKVREALFSAIQNLADLQGAAVWDLFAGSGALGIEALSRGAGRAWFVESHPPTAAAIRANLRGLGLPADGWQVVTARVESWLARGGSHGKPQAPPALVLLDPPYRAGLAEGVLAAIAAAPAVAPGCLVALEAASGFNPPPLAGLELLRTKRYGDTEILLFHKTENSRAKETEEAP